MKRNYKYMHTIRGKPAFYVEGEQIVYASHYVESLCDSLKQIREEQDMSCAWRTKMGFYVSRSEYGYQKVVID